MNTKPKLVTNVKGKKQSIYMNTQVPAKGTQVKGRSLPVANNKPRSAKR